MIKGKILTHAVVSKQGNYYFIAEQFVMRINKTTGDLNTIFTANSTNISIYVNDDEEVFVSHGWFILKLNTGLDGTAGYTVFAGSPQDSGYVDGHRLNAKFAG